MISLVEGSLRKGKAWELVEKGWSQRSFWQDEEGRVCDRDRASRFCLIGSLYATYPAGEAGDKYNIVKDKLSPTLPGIWNDAKERTQEEVVALLKELDI